MLNAFIVANLQLICLEMKLTNICYTVQFAQRKKISCSFKENNPKKRQKFVKSIVSSY